MDIEKMKQLGDLYGNHDPDKTPWKDLPDDEKVARCTHQSGMGKLYKLPGGHVKKQPIYCNLCEACYKRNALKLKDRIDGFREQAEKSEGQWRKKTIDDKTEAASFKKRISRNQEGRHFEVAANDSVKDIYVYVIDEPGKDMDKIYGERVDLDRIDYDAMYQQNRSAGKKMSTGKAFKGASSPSKGEDTIRVKIPQFVIEGGKEKEVETILRQTNYIELADTPEKANQLYDFQLKYLIQELEKESIKIIAIDYKFHNYDPDRLMEQWNSNVHYWMSINASYKDNKEAANLDNLSGRLYQKVFGEPEKLLN
jgi:hypothetical protein